MKRTIDLAAVSFTLAALMVLIAALAGCNTMTVHRPEMAARTVTVHRVDAGRIWHFCSGSLSTLQRVTLSLPVACAWLYTPSMQCHIFATDTTPDATVEHERRHCEGWLHEEAPARQFASLESVRRSAYLPLPGLL